MELESEDHGRWM